MTTFYLDLEAGSDAADGLSFANRWKTIASGATAARIAPGDIIRVMASPDPTLLDASAAWTNASKTVTLSGAVTANIDLCESAWTASANVTATAAAGGKEGTNYVSNAIAAGFTTGLAAYKALGGATDFSGYQQISLWIRVNLAVAANMLQIKLCSDAAGATPVDTINIPALNGTNQWTAITVDTGGALGASIQSVALYAASDPGTVTVLLDNILACKASASADSLTLNSLIGKVHNLSWVASTTYATNDKRRPTQPNRNGFQYKVTAGGGGSSGGSEPTWPEGIGLTVADGALTWTCEDLEDTWHGIQSINGTTVLLDADTATTSAQGRGYYGATETLATYKRQPMAPYATPSTSAATPDLVQDTGTVGNLIRFVGGWDRSAMATQNGETWIDLRNGFGILLYNNTRNYIGFENWGMVRGQYGVYTGSGTDGLTLKNIHLNNSAYGLYVANAMYNADIKGVHSNSLASGGFYSANAIGCAEPLRAIACHSTRSGPGIFVPVSYAAHVAFKDVAAKNSSTYGITWNAYHPVKIDNAVTAGNGTGGMDIGSTDAWLNNCSIAESTEFAAQSAKYGRYIYSQNHDTTPGNHRIIGDGGTIVSATDQRNTASGYSWKFSPTSTSRSSIYPLLLSVAKIAVKSGGATNVKVYTRRDNTNINGLLLLRGGQIAGVPSDVSVACAPSINTWVQSSALAFTPTADGVVEILFLVWDGVGTTNNFWIDDLTVT